MTRAKRIGVGVALVCVAFALWLGPVLLELAGEHVAPPRGFDPFDERAGTIATRADDGADRTTDGPQRSAVDPVTAAPVPDEVVRFTGVVVAAESGVPIAGAVVQPFARTRRLHDVDPRRCVVPPEQTTDADGRFAVDVPRAPDLYLGVRVAATGRLPRQARLGGLRGGVEVGAGVVPLWRACEVFVQALDPDGEPLVGFGLQARSVGTEPPHAEREAVLSFDRDDGAPEAITGPDGVAGPLLLPPGEAELESFATAGRPLPGPFDARRFRVLDVAGPQRVVARILERVVAAPIRGVVVRVDGTPATDVGLEFVAASGEDPLRSSLRIVELGGGRFEAWQRGAPRESEWRAAVGRAWRLARPLDPVPYGAEDVRVVVEPVPLRAVELWIQDERGRPLERFGASFDDPVELWPVERPGGRPAVELLDGVHRLHLRREGAHGDEFALFDIVVDAETTARTLRWPAPVAWPVEVVDRQGNPVARAELRLRISESSEATAFESQVGTIDEHLDLPDVNGWRLVATAVTDERGRARVRAPAVARGAVFRTWADDVEPTTVRVDAAPNPGPLRIVVTRGATIRGRIVPVDVLAETWPDDSWDRRVAAVVEEDWSRPRGPWRVLVELRGLTGTELVRSWRYGPVETDGRFGVDRLAPGDWDVLLESDWMKTRIRLAVVRGLAEGESRDLVLDASAFRSGRANARWSGPVPTGASVSIMADGFGTRLHLEPALDGSLGELRLPEGRYSAFAGWPSTGTVAGAGYVASDLAPIVAGRETTWTIRPPIAGGLRLRLVDAAGAPLAGYTVHVSLPARPTWRFVERRTDANGVATWDPAPAAEPTFVVRLADGHEVHVGPVRMDAGARWTERTIAVGERGR